MLDFQDRQCGFASALQSFGFWERKFLKVDALPGAGLLFSRPSFVLFLYISEIRRVWLSRWPLRHKDTDYKHAT